MTKLKINLLSVALLAIAVSACGARSEEVGEFKNDWIGNEIQVASLRDPKVPGVLCHFARFDRAFWDRLGKGDWFEDPSNTSIDCLRVGPIDLADVDDRASGEEVFSRRSSLFFKNVAVRRIYDSENHVLIYVSHSREIVEGSAKMSVSTVALAPADLAEATLAAAD